MYCDRDCEIKIWMMIFFFFLVPDHPTVYVKVQVEYIDALGLDIFNRCHVGFNK